MAMETLRFVAFAAPAPGEGWLCGQDPLEVIEARRPEQVLPALARAQQAADAGHWAAGFVTYEAAAGLDGHLAVRDDSPLPLLRLGVFERLEPRASLGEPAGEFELSEWQSPTPYGPYAAAIARIKDLIAAGDTYQVNYTIRLLSRFRGEPRALMARLIAAQPSPHAAFIDGDDWAVCSASPELFFELDGELLASRPMKGTAARGLWPADDRRLRQELAESRKDRAENLMILDMVRNDLGRVARFGSVRVSRPFEIEPYPTLYQMTSTVEAQTPASLPEIFRALFPCASITGAPKVRTMQIIRELEDSPRGLYTGAIGYIGPGRRARFNVAIRTVVIHKPSGRAEYGVGGGIVWDSRAESEYAECRTKAGILASPPPRFELLETLRFEPASGFFLLQEHLERLAASGERFGFAVDAQRVRAALAERTAGLGGPSRVRLLVNRAGDCRVEVHPLPPELGRPWRLRLAREPISPQDVFLYHKTTHRAVYERAARNRGDCDDVLLWNPRREATETTIANLVVELGGRLVTPPVECGLLPGVMREHLLRTGQVVEQVVRLEDLPRCTKLFAVNSLRRWLPAAVE